jgi:hypothetical protein
MNENNIRWAAEPDVYLHVHLMLKGRENDNVTLGHGETVNLGPGYTTTYMDKSQFSEGTLIFDLIDARRKNLAWTASATDKLKGNSPLSEMEINQIVDKAFKKFPPKPPR